MERHDQCQREDGSARTAFEHGQSPQKGASHTERRVDRAKAPDRLSHVPLKLLRLSAVKERTGLSRSTIRRLEKQGGFPKRIKISTNIVAWIEDDVIEWIQARADRFAV